MHVNINWSKFFHPSPLMPLNLENHPQLRLECSHREDYAEIADDANSSHLLISNSTASYATPSKSSITNSGDNLS